MVGVGGEGGARLDQPPHHPARMRFNMMVYEIGEVCGCGPRRSAPAWLGASIWLVSLLVPVVGRKALPVGRLLSRQLWVRAASALIDVGTSTGSATNMPVGSASSSARLVERKACCRMGRAPQCCWSRRTVSAVLVGGIV